ncbi:MAG: TetR/AcrR family transcriptional regulator [Deltaproteobacteria bacterium]|nr:TetR/AcrR family transcriptional regulator [Deltaproteobacteria bacterium]
MEPSQRKEREKQIRRLHILEAAKEVFNAKGFNGATMEEIAEKAGYSPAALYLYFKNKYELYISLNINTLDHMVELFENLTAHPDLGSLEKLRRIADVFYEIYEFNPLSVGNLFRLQGTQGLDEMSPDILEKLNEQTTRAIRLVAQIFETGIREGIFLDYHPMALADSVWAQFTGLVIWEEGKRSLDPSKQFLKPTMDMALEILIRGITRN